MATFDEIGNGSVNVGEILKGMTINSLSTMARGLIIEMLSTNIHNFNLMNYDYMNIHMMRNAYEKVITLNTVGESAYTDGNGDAQATPAQYPSYTRGNNYMEFVNNTRQASNNGVLSTRVTNRDGNVRNLYIDDEHNRDAQVEFTGSYLDKNSILYKTKKLIRQNKLKTIVSQFHTEGVEYEGQIGSKYGESHGRNLLTKEAENGTNNYKVNGYDNPYCRVWTHHYQYDKLSKTMRANTSELNTWGGFEWEDTDKGYKKDESHYGDGEKYDYAWRGKHNQERREAHSVLDTKTGLVKITPQYRNGGQKNRHTKDCMFSIENLAWKDYDPYSFEQALSWEQRGPFGGRIMWFPPYGIEITETASAKWNSNEFIGRGEPVYTYTNSERTGNLSFLMITDHPSSIDYASWWDDNTMIKGIDNGDGNSENDYLRYFAGCANGDNDGGDPRNNEPGKTGGLIIKPTPLTDEYLQEQKPPVIKVEKPGDKYPDPNKVKSPSKNPIYVEFFVFYPNNYSGVHDSPTKPDAVVDAIAYLLGGIGGQKIDGVHDSALSLNSVFSFESSENKYIGYEMAKGPITTDDCIENKYYIQGGKKYNIQSGKRGVKEYIPDIEKKWCYRIDHLQPYSGEETDLNTINQVLHGYKQKKYYNYKDEYTIKENEPHKLNLFVSNDIRGMKLKGDDDLYSFAEVAAAFHSSNMVDKPFLYDYLVDCGVNQDRVNKLIDIFTNNNLKLKNISVSGGASSQGYVSFNQTLAKNRNETVYRWLKSYEKWNNVSKEPIVGDKKINPVKPGDENYVNAYSSKLGRCAHCILEFETEGVSNNTENRDLPGFKWVDSKTKEDGSVWNYYQQDGTVRYFEQESVSSDNYQEESESTQLTLKETQILKIFENDNFKPKKIETVRTKKNFCGIYTGCGVYNHTWDYSNPDFSGVEITKFVDGGVYAPGDYFTYNGRIYSIRPLVVEQPIYIQNIEDLDKVYDVTEKMSAYAEGDIIIKYTSETDFKYLKSKVNFIEKYENPYDIIEFNNDDWEEALDTDISELVFNNKLSFLTNKIATVLGMGVDELVDELYPGYEYTMEDNPDFDYIFDYGLTGNLELTTETDLIEYINTLKQYAENYQDDTLQFRFSEEEVEYLNAIVNGEEKDITEQYIILSRILDNVEKIKDENGNIRDVNTEALKTEQLQEKVVRKDEQKKPCNNNLWVDRGDGLLIQECNIGNDGVIARFNASTGEGDWNKLRYDQEYHFFKQYMEDHPLIFEKLQEKIKYFNPAFHSMTPEGFNARLNFLHQCTRQGNTKTMSDLGGKTANNLAFGRPPYCVLRLGDFYYQMIVIDNITFDYSVSDGLQWDLNTEGNGVQPMLCKVNISFKFIGGGDITGPVQRLQNAMSFNYYANTSFYDNRADRVEYKPTNWATMGGAGNNEVDLKNSYAYIAKLYEDQPDHIIK